MKKKSSKFSSEVRERAVRSVREQGQSQSPRQQQVWPGRPRVDGMIAFLNEVRSLKNCEGHRKPG